jgi:hypothetical protein
MITINIDVEDGLVNGVAGILKYIEPVNEQPVDYNRSTSSGGEVTNICLWLYFNNPQQDASAMSSGYFIY